MRVVYWNNIPSPYMVDRFNVLADSCPFDFEVWFSDRSHGNRSWMVDESQWCFQYRYVPVTRLLGHTVHWPWLVWITRPTLLVSGYSEPVWVFGWALAKMLGVRTAFRVLKTFDSWVTRSWWKNALKRFLFRYVDAIETVGSDGQAYAVSYGADASKVFVCTHTVDLSRFPEDLRTSDDRARVRRKLALNGVTFLYVGRLVEEKGVFDLLDAFAQVQREFRGASKLLLVGDGRDETGLHARTTKLGLKNVVFAGFVQRAKLTAYYAAADVFVFPTLGDPYGLVVDEAMAAGLPIVCTSSAGEIRARVQDGVNGWVAEPSNPRSLAKPMIKLAIDPELRTSMGLRSRQRVLTHTPERWAAQFQAMVHALTEHEQVHERTDA